MTEKLAATGHEPKTSSVQATPVAAVKRKVCVFCGSGSGKNPAYAEAAQMFGRELVAAGLGLVYGGGSLGLMGEVARSVLGAGGHVTGIIPEFLSAKERMLTEVNDLIVTADMHERKRLMFEHSDAFVALPGGIGTLEEMVEQMTWAQLGRHNKPVVLANVAGFWNRLKALLEHMRQEAFIRPGLEVRFSIVDQIGDVVPLLTAAFAAGAGQDVDTSIGKHF
ncbi:MAG: TIGR00730 family Rossman fold protein [Proteobacteria bacterium]|nr:TIGR00730 family Rossman fold protein [Pseudomonadota bacterium]